MLGLAENFLAGQQGGNRPGSQMDVNTPKLLRNLKNKNTDKNRIHKKNDKRGFRSQFINDLHEEN